MKVEETLIYIKKFIFFEKYKLNSNNIVEHLFENSYLFEILKKKKFIPQIIILIIFKIKSKYTINVFYYNSTI